MKRFFFILLLFFVILQPSPLYALTPTPISTPSEEGLVGGVPFLGVNCGLAGDPDFKKSRCCVLEKQDNSILTTIGSIASGLPVVGGFFSSYSEKYQAIVDLSETMAPCAPGSVASTPTDLSSKSCVCIQAVSETIVPKLSDFCTKYFKESKESGSCSQCMVAGGFYTALGCIPLDLSTFITSYILTIGIGIAGGIALLCILYSAFRMQTSMGNAEALKKAQENLTACITGLIIIIFSVLILKIIGVDILRIPGIG